MSKELLLVRHSDAEAAIIGMKDITRELSPQGFAKASRAGQLLGESGLKIDLLATSSATRALTTAELLAERIGYAASAIVVDESLYNASPRILLDYICRLPNACQSVMIVNHNPGITYIAEYLTGEAIGNMAPCGMAKIVFACEQWSLISQRSGQLAWYREFDS